ncbi:HD domain-containing protein [Lactococcus hodotermopsidis]|uniref:bis(5'-nucleosyl)-tetraphosphatase (symmetrical) n=1 Tax=Pseudolactococcus hodotermopsidis TaxID=2709157 RepID=A0A6A0BG92_9LACT|nr:bis(5'-nucleosyl)-tetraphosphatase (symmetrical) YqeK [Lactococcus hodotermopsidis]GFH43378.1 HD domain-containing protein [Lactococcus hodotermopsidis]
MAFDFFPEINLSRAELLTKLSNNMSEKRFQHVQNVGIAAVKLAERWGYADVRKAELAGLLHDYAKEETDKTFILLIQKYQLDPDLYHWDNNVWHGMVGIYKIREDFGLTDSEILRAIEIHTVGSSDMTLLDKILYVADYIETGRNFDGVDFARTLAFEQDLNAAVAYETVRTVEFLAHKKLPIYPQTILTYNAFIKNLRFY